MKGESNMAQFTILGSKGITAEALCLFESGIIKSQSINAILEERKNFSIKVEGYAVAHITTDKESFDKIFLIDKDTRQVFDTGSQPVIDLFQNSFQEKASDFVCYTFEKKQSKKDSRKKYISVFAELVKAAKPEISESPNQ